MADTTALELDRLAEMVRREASAVTGEARAAQVVGGSIEVTLNATRYAKAKDLRRVADVLAALAVQKRRAHLTLVR